MIQRTCLDSDTPQFSHLFRILARILNSFLDPMATQKPIELSLKRGQRLIVG